jgi:hypothetical protein
MPCQLHGGRGNLSVVSVTVLPTCTIHTMLFVVGWGNAHCAADQQIPPAVCLLSACSYCCHFVFCRILSWRLAVPGVE